MLNREFPDTGINIACSAPPHLQEFEPLSVEICNGPIHALKKVLKITECSLCVIIVNQFGKSLLLDDVDLLFKVGQSCIKLVVLINESLHLAFRNLLKKLIVHGIEQNLACPNAAQLFQLGIVIF